MDKLFAIFDLDGTLADSMPYWAHLTEEYLAIKGVSKLPDDLYERIAPMTVTESAALFIELFGLEGTPESVAGEIDALMCRHYIEDIPLKEGAADYVKGLWEKGVRLCVASATAKELIDACLERLGLLQCFDFTISCESVGAGKKKPDVYHAAAARLGAKPGDIAVYEDALYALETAKAAGYYTVGVYDDSAGHSWSEIEKTAHELIIHW